MPALAPHPDTSAARRRIDIGVVRVGAGLALRYAVSGATGLRIASPAAPERTDELWKTTCFECFIRTESGGYLEFNFAPSSRWAAYAFSAYREGMRPLTLPAPKIDFKKDGGDAALDAILDLRGIGDLPAGNWTMAVTAVLEDTSGVKSYWALRHPPGKPDFHHQDGFDLIVSPEG